MALYKDGNPVSGLNSIPRLTLAQYNALNVKPEIWIRTDAPESYKKLSADQVSYDSNNTVKDKIDNLIKVVDKQLTTNNDGAFNLTSEGNFDVVRMYILNEPSVKVIDYLTYGNTVYAVPKNEARNQTFPNTTFNVRLIIVSSN